MSQELVPSDQNGYGVVLRERQILAGAGGVNAGAVTVEMERAIAEAQGQLILAKRFPRDLPAAFAELMESCKIPAMAEAAFYKVPRAGGTVSGPSIRLAEELVRVCGNIDYGHIELSRDDHKSEIEVFAWDKQTNVRRKRQVTVLHVIDTKNGPKACRDQKDIDDLIANKASKQMRGLMLSLIPPWMKQAAIDECKKTLAGDNGGKTIAQRVRDMTQAFSPFGVTVELLETHLGHKLDQTVADELVELSGIYNALREGGKPSEYFGSPEEDEKTDAAAALTAAGKADKSGDAKKVAGATKAQEKPKEAAQDQAKPETKTEGDKPASDAAGAAEEVKSAKEAETAAQIKPVEEPPEAEATAEPAGEPAPAARKEAVF